MGQVTLEVARENKGLSIADVAQVLKIDKYVMGHYELHSGSVPISMAIKLAKVYGLTIDELEFDVTEDSGGLMDALSSI